MTRDDRALPFLPRLRRTRLRTGGTMSVLGARVADWLATAATYYAAAVTYERLCALSDAELQPRGLSRANLARELCNACASTGR